MQDELLELRPLTLADRQAVLAATCASQNLHHPWVSAPTTDAEFEAWVKSKSTPRHEALLLWHRADQHVVGYVGVNEIVAGSFQSAYLGYWINAHYARQGMMTRGLPLAIDYAFVNRGLHRLEANIQPENAGSRAVVRKLGFVKEGFSKRYLKIAGAWRDHERWALTRELWSPAYAR